MGEAVGLTLSEAQKAYCDRHNPPGCSARLESWTEHVPGESYDAIVSIGALEHAARSCPSREEKVDVYRGFFERCRELLRPGGRLAVQAIAKGDRPLSGGAFRDVVLLARHVFPEADVPRLSELTAACEGVFEVRALRNDRAMYARTCSVWLDALRARREEARRIVDEDTVCFFERYLEASVRQLEAGHLGLLRLALERVDAGASARGWGRR